MLSQPIINFVETYLAAHPRVLSCDFVGAPRVRQDLQAALRVLSGRQRAWDQSEHVLKLSRSDLVAIDVAGHSMSFAQAEFKGAWLFKIKLLDVDLNGANFEGICAVDCRSFGKSRTSSIADTDD